MTADSPTTPDRLTRRRFLFIAGAGSALAACGSSSSTSPTPTTTTTAAAGATTTTAAAGNATVRPDCVLTPAAAEGPFYADTGLVRADMSEGRAGVPLDIELTVVDAATCAPLAGATIDLWHADAGGRYSAFAGQGDDRDIDMSDQTFLRGIQPTDADGVATIRTIYPGWYPGRTTHVHLKVHFDDQTRVTSQLYFPEGVTALVYEAEAYAERGPKDTSNQADGLGADDASLLMTVEPAGDGYRATHVIGIAR